MGQIRPHPYATAFSLGNWVLLPTGLRGVVVGQAMSGWAITEQIDAREYGDLGKFVAYPDDELRLLTHHEVAR